MAYTVENGMWRAVFATPCDIVDTHLKLIGEIPLKVLLVLLRYNGDLGVSALSTIVGRPEPVISEALEYLLREGLVKSPDFSPSPQQSPAAEAVPKKVKREIQLDERKIAIHSIAPRQVTHEEIAELAETDEAVAWLLQESQVVLGRTLRRNETATLVDLYATHGMKPDIIMMVLQYCAGIEKSKIGYIDAVAKEWIASGIETHEQAEREIKRRKEQISNESRIKRAFGIYDRNLVPYERNVLSKWFDDYGFDIPVITVAFERSVETKGKLSFAYINGILANWHEKGISTPAEALREITESREKLREKYAKKTQDEAAKPSSYDLDELEAMLRRGEL